MSLRGLALLGNLQTTTTSMESYMCIESKKQTTTTTNKPPMKMTTATSTQANYPATYISINIHFTLVCAPEFPYSFVSQPSVFAHLDQWDLALSLFVCAWPLKMGRILFSFQCEVHQLVQSDTSDSSFFSSLAFRLGNL